MDIGCGNGLLTLIVGKKCNKIYGIDITKTSILTARYRAQFCKNKMNTFFIPKKIEDAEFKSNSFDKVLSICVLEHIFNYQDVLKEVYRVLKTDGHMMFSVDSFENIKEKKIRDYHSKKYSVENYFNSLF